MSCRLAILRRRSVVGGICRHRYQGEESDQSAENSRKVIADHVSLPPLFECPRCRDEPKTCRSEAWRKMVGVPERKSLRTELPTLHIASRQYRIGTCLGERTTEILRRDRGEARGPSLAAGASAPAALCKTLHCRQAPEIEPLHIGHDRDH
jgi:hypothetical protein